MNLTHTRLLVDDVEACQAWYRDVLGLRATIEAGDGIYVELDAGDAILALYRRDLMARVVRAATGPLEQNPPDRVVVTFAVDDVDSAYEALTSRGAQFVTQPHDQEAWVIRVAHLRDPDGKLVEIYAPLG